MFGSGFAFFAQGITSQLLTSDIVHKPSLIPSPPFSSLYCFFLLQYIIYILSPLCSRGHCCYFIFCKMSNIFMGMRYFIAILWKLLKAKVTQRWFWFQFSNWRLFSRSSSWSNFIKASLHRDNKRENGHSLDCTMSTIVNPKIYKLIQEPDIESAEGQSVLW